MEKKNIKKYTMWIWVLVGIIFIFNVLLGLSLQKTTQLKSTTSSGITQAQTKTIQYKGEAGKDALSLLKKHYSVEQNASGLVVSINGRKANDGKHQFWAFYVNGKMSQVGAGDYKTQSSDNVEWKIEKY